MPNAERFTKTIPEPTPDSINTGLTNLRQATVMELFGAPSDRKAEDCGPVTNPRLKAKIVTQSVGPFRVTGHKAAVESLAGVLADVKAADPDLYGILGTAGMLCARKVRGGESWSNHSWGFAVDLTVGGKLDTRGDGFVQVGLMRLYPFFHKAGWWWGAEFPTEDGMHFEIADETIRKWAKEGRL
jgi:hypothetical protein